MGNRYNFKPFDKVLVRNNDDEKWQIDIFESEKLSEFEMTYNCLWSIWSQCIPYEGNEHLLRKTDSPGKYDPNKNELFGVKLKSGYVLEVENRGMGVLFPIQEKDSPNKKEFAIIYPQGRWFNFENIDPAEVVAIHGYAKSNYLGSGDILWKRSIPQKFTKAQIAEKLGINVQDFEIVDEENKEANKMKITDLRIGDIVCNPRTKFPMRVVSLFEDGTVYLDFDGNEGDVFEDNCKDLVFAEEEPKRETAKRAEPSHSK